MGKRGRICRKAFFKRVNLLRKGNNILYEIIEIRRGGGWN
jgi:hypothetical protein